MVAWLAGAQTGSDPAVGALPTSRAVAVSRAAARVATRLARLDRKGFGPPGRGRPGVVSRRRDETLASATEGRWSSAEPGAVERGPGRSAGDAALGVGLHGSQVGAQHVEPLGAVHEVGEALRERR